jgi:hypothetical protein
MAPCVTTAPTGAAVALWREPCSCPPVDGNAVEPLIWQAILIAHDLELGALLVVVEAREAGKGVGIFDKSGAVDESEVDQPSTSWHWKRCAKACVAIRSSAHWREVFRSDSTSLR